MPDGMADVEVNIEGNRELLREIRSRSNSMNMAYRLHERLNSKPRAMER